MLWMPAIGILYALYIVSTAFFVIGLFKIAGSFERSCRCCDENCQEKSK
jgi:hypothetical protein